MEDFKGLTNSGAFCTIEKDARNGIYTLKIVRYMSNNKDKKSIAISMFTFSKKGDVLKEISKQKL